MKGEVRNIEVWGSTADYLESICQRYKVNPNTVLKKGLRLAELDLAEFEARMAAIQQDGFDEAE